MEENNLNSVPQQTVTPPPVQPAEKKKGNVGLIIGIGCGALLVIGIVIAIIVTLIIVVFASSGKTMKCTYSISTYGCTTNVEANLKFKGDKVDKVNMEGYVDCSASSYKETMLNTFETTLGNQTDIQNIKRSGDRITFDYKDAAGLNLKTGEKKEGISYDQAKKQLQTAGYKCE